jgi:hypothetical protein
MIVDVVNVQGFTVFESKNDSPVSASRDRPESRKPAGQPMKTKARQCSILNSGCSIQDAKDQPQSLLVLRPDAGVTSGFEEFAQPFMRKAANHEASVTNNVTGYN